MLRVRILFWPEEPWRNFAQKNAMSILPSQDSGSPRRVDYRGGDSREGTIAAVGPEVGQSGCRGWAGWGDSGGASRTRPPIS